MRLKKSIVLVGAILLLGPAAVTAQGDTGCSFLSSGNIDDRSWSDIQAYLKHLVTVQAFDEHPLVADRQSLVRRGNPKQARGMALVAGRPSIESESDTRLWQGCFVGYMDSENFEPEVGAFRGKTFVWIDRKGPGDTWRTIQFPLDGASFLDAGTTISNSFLVPSSSDSIRGASMFPRSDAHLVFRGSMEQITNAGHDFHGARWLMAIAAQKSTGSPILYSLSSMAGLEVMACYRCDGTTCCPQDLQLTVF